jgi:hypothetical protein
MAIISVENGERGYTVALGTSSDEEIDYQFESQQLLKTARRRGLEVDCAILELPLLVSGEKFNGNMGTVDLEASRAILLDIPLANTVGEPNSIHCLLTNEDRGTGWRLHGKIVLEYGDDTDFAGRTFVQKLSQFGQ